MQGGNATEEDQGWLPRGLGSDRSKFPEMDFQLQDLATYGGANGQAVQFGLGGFQVRSCLFELRFGLLGCEATLFELICAGNVTGGEGLDVRERVFGVGELSFSDLDRCFANGCFRAQRAVVYRKEGIAGLHAAADLDEDFGDDAGDLRADGDVFGAGFDNSGARDEGLKVRLRRV